MHVTRRGLFVCCIHPSQPPVNATAVSPMVAPESPRRTRSASSALEVAPSLAWQSVNRRGASSRPPRVAQAGAQAERTNAAATLVLRLISKFPLQCAVFLGCLLTGFPFCSHH